MEQQNYSIGLIPEIKARVALSELLAAVGVQARGRSARCPFHDDKNPSMSLDLERSLFYCHRCGFGGDQITFTEHHQNLSRGEAIKWLAHKYDLASHPPTPEQRQRWVEDARQREEVRKRQEQAEALYDTRCKTWMTEWQGADRFVDAATRHLQRIMARMDLPNAIREHAEALAWQDIALGLQHRERAEAALDALVAP